jgi:hypothetical protein
MEEWEDYLIDYEKLSEFELLFMNIDLELTKLTTINFFTYCI